VALSQMGDCKKEESVDLAVNVCPNPPFDCNKRGQTKGM